MPRFIHTADVHMDAAFAAHFDKHKAEIRRMETRECFSRICNMAKSCDMLLIAGDLFDGENVTDETLAFLKRQFADLYPIPVFIVAGNHDPYFVGSVYDRENFGENVHIFKNEFECVEIPELKTRVFGKSFGRGLSINRCQVPKIEKKDGITDILLLHGTYGMGAMFDDEFPIENIEECGADYLALGHIHNRSEVKKSGSTYYAYCGAPEGRGFDECGDKGCYVVTAGQDEINAEFKSTCGRKIHIISVDMTEFTDSLDAISGILRKMDEVGSVNDMYRLILSGRIRKNCFNMELVEEKLSENAFFLEIKDKTVPDFDIDELSKQNNICGEFIKNMYLLIEKSEGEDKEKAREALLLGVEALLGGDSDV